ncbi:hypothetical protein EDB86DRAFT_3091062 [Lactarius hatsudake]|nr:hypothetical protein EDB86DRAFT_3091062 [Lactarius hatsudake]
MALHYVEKMKAKTPTPRQTLIHELVQEFSMHPRSLGSNDRRDSAFRWITQSLQSLKDTVLLDPAWKRRVQRSYKLLIDKLSAYPEGLKLSQDALHARLGEAAMNTGSVKDAQVAIDVDPPPKRQRTGDYTPTSLSSPVSFVPSAAVPSRSTSTPQRRARLQQASQFPTPRQPSAVPPSPHAYRFGYIYPYSRFLSRPGSGLGGPRGARVDARHVPISTSARTRIVWRRYERLLF